MGGMYEQQMMIRKNLIILRTLRQWKVLRGVKARFIVRGDQEIEADPIARHSSTVNKTNIKIFFLNSAQKGWKIKTDGVKAAF